MCTHLSVGGFDYLSPFVLGSPVAQLLIQKALEKQWIEMQVNYIQYSGR